MSQILFISGWAHSPKIFEGLSNKFDSYKIRLESIHSILKNSNYNYKKENFALALNDFLKSYPKPPIVIAWSMGSMILTEVLSANNSAVKKAVLLGATLKFCKSENYEYGIEKKNVKFMIRMLPRKRASVLKSFYTDCATPNRIDLKDIEKKIEQISNISILELIEGLNYLIESDLRKLPNIDSENSILIHGKEDVVIPCSARDYFCESQNIKSTETIEKSGHDLLSNDFGKVYKIIDSFLKK